MPSAAQRRTFTFTRLVTVAILNTHLAMGQGVSEQAVVKRQDKVEILDPIVVTASRTAEDASTVPQSVVVVGPEEIGRKQATAPIELLKNQPGIWAVSVAAQGSPILRGQIGNRVLYLWDGVRINNGALFGGPNGFFNQFPLGAIDRMEIVLGSGSVQYGSDAIGGVVNVISKYAEFTDSPETGGSIYGRIGSFSNVETADFFSSTDKVAVSGGVSRQEINSYRGPTFGELSPSGYDAIGGFANFAFKPTNDQLLRLSFIYNKRTDVDSYVQSKLNSNGIPRIFGPLEERGIGKLDYTLSDLASWSDELKFYGYYQFYNAERERRVQTTPAFNNTIRRQDQNVWGLGVQNVKEWDTVRLIVGADHRKEDLSSSQALVSRSNFSGMTSLSEPAGSTPDGTYDVFDTFATLNWKPTDKVLLTAGLRFESTHIDSDPEQLDVIPDAGYTVDDLRLDKRWNSVVWNLGGIYSFTPEFSMVGNVGSGFRAPTYSDTLSAGTPVFSSRIASLPSPDVDPEKSITVEFGPRYNSAGVKASLTGFYTKLNDVVGSTESGTVDIPGQGTFIASRKSNSGEAYVAGGEASLEYEFSDGWSVFGNASYAYGQDETADDPLRFIPPFFGTLGLRYEEPSGKWWMEISEVMAASLNRHSMRDEQDAGFSSDPGLGSPNSTTNLPLRSDFSIPGFAVTNIAAGLNVWDTESSKFDLTANINNVFNTSYREAYSQQQREAPGINFALGARLTF